MNVTVNVRTYLRQRLPFFVIMVAVSLTAAVLLYLVSDSAYLAWSISALLFCGSCLALVPEYFSRYRYYQDLADALDGLDRKRLLAEVIERPSFFEGQLLHDTVRAVGKSCNDEVSAYSQNALEYREYLEMWVHEIKTPIAGAKLAAENTGNERAVEELEKIERLVQQVLFCARSNSVDKDYVIRRCELAALISDFLRTNARYLIAHNIRIETRDLNYSVSADSKWLFFILWQLVNNAVKYGTDSLSFHARTQDNNRSLCIADTGIGIPLSDQGRIFDKGFTGENGRRFGASTGLGLYLCRKLCREMGLDIRLASSTERGSCFEIVFPGSDPEESPSFEI
ncbi:MAG: sensor histidine kinase [Actinomycetes bacterium]|jgi:signal transduction histidine kinase|nr:sensor histidine kinase [Actinomycetes bacterium]